MAKTKSKRQMKKNYVPIQVDKKPGSNICIDEEGDRCFMESFKALAIENRRLFSNSDDVYLDRGASSSNFKMCD